MRQGLGGQNGPWGRGRGLMGAGGVWGDVGEGVRGDLEGFRLGGAS